MFAFCCATARSIEPAERGTTARGELWRYAGGYRNRANSANGHGETESPRRAGREASPCHARLRPDIRSEENDCPTSPSAPTSPVDLAEAQGVTLRRGRRRWRQGQIRAVDETDHFRRGLLRVQRTSRRPGREQGPARIAFGARKTPRVRALIIAGQGRARAEPMLRR